MAKRFKSRPFALALLCVAGAAMLPTAGFLVRSFASLGELSIRKQWLGCLFTWSWMAIPYLVIMVAARYLAPWRRRSAALFVATVIATAFAVWEPSLSLLYPTSTSALGLLVMPLMQLLGILVVTWISLSLMAPDPIAD